MLCAVRVSTPTRARSGAVSKGSQASGTKAKSLKDKAKSGADLRPAARKIIYVPETARLEKLLQLLLDRKLHLASV